MATQAGAIPKGIFMYRMDRALNLDVSQNDFDLQPPRAQRLFDLCLATLGLIVTAPLLLLIALLVRLSSKGPALFRQKRIGRFGEPFEILKFRTMVVDAEKQGMQLTVGRDARVTGIGRFLRDYKLDELPQLINVLKGEMSVIGPRPEVPRYVERYTEHQRRILSLRPGISSAASIDFHRENDILAASADPEQFYCEEVLPAKIRRDLDYARNATIWSDCLILFQTVFRILR
jgi:lipopolysaccharide/colanic/teichoic acid biosynthesis glycosyltransferase